MTDRELLERAARAAGYTVRGWIGERIQLFDPITEWAGFEWNPLTSDADAFRLADKLGLIVDTWNERVILASRYGLGHRDWTHVSDDELYDGLEATRRAITRAAAAIGEQK